MPIWSDSIPQFDELYSISDLHMGGRGAGAQIFDSGSELANFITHLRTKPAKLALVINGDMVDFLAEPNAKAFDPEKVTSKITRIANDPAFKPVFAALQKFVRTKGRRLIITLGNHDLELALPWARATLLDVLAGDNDAARGRITLAFDGSGFLARVGNATLLCLHGNEVDDWNITDHETIRRFGRDVHQGRALGAWIPNAGTYLVLEVMNDIKEGYPFVDLLKPELEGVIPVLLAVAPEKRDRIIGAFPVLRRLVLDKVRRATGLLGAQDQAEEIAITGAPVSIQRKRMDPDTLMVTAEQRLLMEVQPISLISEAQEGEQLGFREAAWNVIRGSDRRETLRMALERLQKDHSFEWSQDDDTFRQFDEAVGPEIDFIITGHTHLHRALRRRKTNGGYLNSGTWARLIRLLPKVLAEQAEFNKVYGALAAGSMEALDNCPDLVLRRRTVVAVRTIAEGTRGELTVWNSDQHGTGLQQVDPDAGMTKV